MHPTPPTPTPTQHEEDVGIKSLFDRLNVLHTFEITSADLVDCSCLADVAQIAAGAIAHDVMTMLREREAAAAAAEAEAAALAHQERGVFEEPSQTSLTVSVASADAGGLLDAGPSVTSKGGAAVSKGGASKGKEEPLLAAGSVDGMGDSMASVVVAAPWPLTYAPLPQDLARALQALWQVRCQPVPPTLQHWHTMRHRLIAPTPPSCLSRPPRSRRTTRSPWAARSSTPCATQGTK